MTPEPSSLQTGIQAGAVPARPDAAAPARRGLRLDQRYVAPLLITAILLAGHLTFGILESPLMTGLAILTAIAMELALGRLFWGKWPHLASAYISGISVGILVRSPFIWPFALCSAISITSKYVLRVRDRHIWNPSNFGIVAMLFLAPYAVASLSVQLDNRLWAMLVIWTLGSIIIWRLKRFHICLTYALSFTVLAWVRSLITGHSFLLEWGPITGPMYQLFTFFMITDPKTTVRSRNGQILVAFLVALMEAFLRLLEPFGITRSLVSMGWHDAEHLSIHAPYLALFIVGPIANLWEIWRTGKKKPEPTAATA